MFFLWLVRSLASCGILWHLVASCGTWHVLNSPQQLFWLTSCLSFPPNSCEQSEINSASPGGKPLQKSLHWSCRLARNKFTGCAFFVDWLHGGICNEGMLSWWEIVSYGLCLLNTCKCTWQQEPAWKIAEHVERHVFHAFIPKVPTEQETWCSHQQHFGGYVPRAIRSIHLYPWWPRQPTETEDSDWWSTRGHHLDLSWHDWNWQLDPFGSIWILHHLGTSRNLGFDPWSELKPVMKSLRHVVTVMRCHEHHIFRVPHWHQVVSLSFSNAWRSGSFTMCMHIYAAMHIPSHSRPFYKSTSIAHRLSLPIWASILGRLAPCCVSTNLTIFNLLFLDEITRTVSAAFQTC